MAGTANYGDASYESFDSWPRVTRYARFWPITGLVDKRPEVPLFEDPYQHPAPFKYFAFSNEVPTGPAGREVACKDRFAVARKRSDGSLECYTGAPETAAEKAAREAAEKKAAENPVSNNSKLNIVAPDKVCVSKFSESQLRQRWPAGMAPPDDWSNTYDWVYDCETGKIKQRFYAPVLRGLDDKRMWVFGALAVAGLVLLMRSRKR